MKVHQTKFFGIIFDLICFLICFCNIIYGIKIKLPIYVIFCLLILILTLLDLYDTIQEK